MTAPLVTPSARVAPRAGTPLRVAFVGAGWIGTRRAQRLLAADDGVPVEVEAVAIVDPETNAAAHLASVVGGQASRFTRFEAMLEQSEELDLDAVVIATPSAQHASQAIAAFGAGLSAFVQKPLARTAEETRAVVVAARDANCSLGVDFSYRGVQGMCTARRLIAEGVIGDPFAVELVFHNAYGPDKAWFYDRPQSGGGCLMDLGCHLVDMLHWLCPNDPVLAVHAQRYAEGSRLAEWDTQCEDFALATMTTTAGVTARLACSWRSHTGQDAVIGATVYGTRGGVQFTNVGGSFTRFQVHHLTGTQRVLLAESDENWDGKEIRHWAQRLSRGERFCAERSAHYLTVADVMDRLYQQ